VEKRGLIKKQTIQNKKKNFKDRTKRNMADNREAKDRGTHEERERRRQSSRCKEKEGEKKIMLNYR
jgi:hypothetical protein